MRNHDPDIEALREQVDCRSVLERAGWRMDRKESTRRAVKYRRGAGEIIIVTHEGRGWFDPLSPAKGDVFSLAQHLWGGNFSAARPCPGPSSRPADAVSAPKQGTASA